MADQEEQKPGDETVAESAQDEASPAVPEVQVQEGEETPTISTENTTTEPTEQQTNPDENSVATEEGSAPTGEVQEDADAGDVKPADEGEQKVVEEAEGEQAEAPQIDTENQVGKEVKPEGEPVEGEVPVSEAEPQQEGETTADGDETKPSTADGEEDKPAGEGGIAVEGDEGEQKPEGDEGTGEQPAAEEGEEKKEGETEEESVQEVSKSPVPQSDTFAEGERAESPTVGVGERLSREGSPVEATDIQVPDILEPGTPERSRPGSPAEGTVQLATFEEEQEEEEEEEDDQPEFDREELIEKYHQAITEREQLQQQNYTLQNKLADYFKKKKADESRQDYDKNVTDQEQRYLKYMAQLEDLRGQDLQERENYRHQMQELKSRCEDKKERVDEERQRFMEYKKQVALNALNSRSGRPIAPKDIEVYLNAENKKETDVVVVRLENIKLKNKLKKKEQQLKSKEELAEGLHLIDFEQLKIENQTYNEKIEERNEELLKLRKKITSTVQVLTHLKEKLQYVQAENQVQKRNLREVEADVAQKRDILSRTKQARDALRIDNQRLRQNSGLLGNEPLLRDFEERKDEGDDLREKLEQLKMQHAELTLHCSQVRRKIEQARNGRA